MIFKLRQKLSQSRITKHNRLPNLYSRKFIINYLRYRRLYRTSGPIRASLGLNLWKIKSAAPVRNQIHRAQCFLSGRSRGTSRRHAVARTKVRELATIGLLLGLKKSSW